MQKVAVMCLHFVPLWSHPNVVAISSEKKQSEFVVRERFANFSGEKLLHAICDTEGVFLVVQGEVLGRGPAAVEDGVQFGHPAFQGS
jgi:hypothetical protein